MLNYAPLPDLLALTILVFVFWSILRRRAGGKLQAWLLGWIFILIHFATRIFGGRPGDLQTFVYTLSAMMLALAGAAFIYAAGAGHYSWRLRWIAGTGLFATLLYILLVYLNVTSTHWYYAADALLFASVVAVFFRDPDSPTGGRNVYAFSVLFLVILLGLAIHRGQQDYGLNGIYFVIYLMAGVQYWRKFPHRTTGSLTAVVGFVVWALVFPVSVFLSIYRPSLHIQDSVWNIPKYIVAIGILLTLLEEQIDHTHHLALHDPLTGLPNRRLLQDRLTKAIERAERNGARVAVLLIDLDHFKQINDTYGHPVGDEVLRIVATRLQMRIRKADTIARAGGDEFIVVVSDLLQPHGAQVLAAKLAADLNEPIVIGAVRLPVGASIGLGIYPDDAQTVEDLCAKADANMYEQKRHAK
ncbi:MAG: diguanylate cyclase domain-containing protein [Acidobacteriaceae bacterium]